MTRGILFSAGAVLAAAGAFAMWLLAGPATAERALSDLDGSVERGAYVARLAGCIPCHTDPNSGRGVLAGGPPLETAFGIFYGPNITPHATEGIGGWGLADFARALTAGESPDGSHYDAFCSLGGRRGRLSGVHIIFSNKSMSYVVDICACDENI